MKKTYKILCLSVVALSLTASVSSCSAKWSEVTDFLNDVYTSIEGSWEGAEYDYEVTYSYKEKHYKAQYTLSEKEVYKDTSSGLVARTKYEYHSKINDNGKKSKKDIKEEDYITTVEKKQRLFSRSKIDGEVEYYSYSYSGSYSSELSNFNSVISATIAQYTSSSADSLGISSATKGNHSISWSVYDRYEPYTVTLKTDRNYVVNYLSFESSVVDKTDGVKETLTTKEVFKRVGGGALHAPTWANKRNFPRYFD
ncbi:MAG: hypothetical protein LUC31_00435 [Coprobacillus sp.]|nr:hypothetical protein [Coprobacillus sp.]